VTSAAWQRVLDRYPELFVETAQGASVAVVPRFARGADGRQRPVVMPASDPVPMLLWRREPDAMRAREAEFRGLKGLVSDLLLIAGDGALEEALAHERQLRSGRMLFMVMRTRDELRERGWSDFIESLGLPFLGTCR
jgi:hypothetical protein